MRLGKKRSIETPESIQRKIREGYGRGEGLNYKPWFTGHEFASQGKYIRLLGRTIPRLYVFVSQLEADAFVIYDSMSDVVDIYEQYYLDLPITLKIADELHIRHPRIRSTLHPVTADIVVKRSDQSFFARSIKTSKDLDDERTVQKLNIEQSYFQRLGIDWKIVTENEINRDYVQNLQWLYYEPGFRDVLGDHPPYFQCQEVVYQMLTEDHLPLYQIIPAVEDAYAFPEGTCMLIFKELVRKKRIHIDLTKPINKLDPLHQACPEFFAEGRQLNERYASYG